MRLLLGWFLMFSFVCFSQQQENIDFTKIDAEIKPNPNSSLSGIATYEFKGNQFLDSLVFDAVGMEFSNILFKGEKVTHLSSYNGKQLKIGLNLVPDYYKIQIKFTAHPKQTVYFIQTDSSKHSEQVWTQGQGKYTSHWLPSFDNMNEKLEFDLTFHVSPEHTVIANGKLLETKEVGNLKSWKFDMTRPMSSYLAAFVIGDFDKKTVHSKSGIPIELYYEPEDSLKVEPTYRYTKEIFDFLEKEIGVGYPWQNYKQVPVQDFLYAGMENTTCTIFSNQYVIDSTAFVDKNYVNVNAHELAHQWFGNLVTEVSGEHHWLHEGFATYYAYLAEKKLFGEDHFYWKLYQTAKTLNNLSENGDGEALTNPNANSLTFYEKGAWALVMLRASVGDDAFVKGIQNYLNSYAHRNATIADFLEEMKKVSGLEMTSFRQQWLEAEEFPWSEVQSFLKEKSKSLRIYLRLNKSLKEYPKRFDPFMRMWDGFESDNLKMELIKDFGTSFLEPFFIEKLKKESLKVRQALTLSVDSIPRQFKRDFETFLDDKSYFTQEVLLFKLWQSFPEERIKYLDQLQGIQGLPNKNVRLLWLTLALITENYRAQEKKDFYDELNSYTNSNYNFEVRQLAFQYLYQIQALSDESLKSLVKACDHHVWQFKKTSRNLVREIHKTDEGKGRITRLKSALNEKEKQLLEMIIKS